MAPRVTLLALVTALGLLSIGCSDDPAQRETTFPAGAMVTMVNSDIGLGPSRVLLGVIDADGSRLGSPDQVVDIELAPASDREHRIRVPGEFTWVVEDAFGVYRAEVNFDQPGAWSATVVPDTGVPLATEFVVLEETFSPNIGDLAPAVDTPTVADHRLGQLTTDPDPDPEFYELSIADAVSSGRTTVVVFSTPAYCQTAACGPLLDTVKDLSTGYPEVNFVHVEVYTGLEEPDFTPDAGHLAPAVTGDHWNLISEPWVFVVDQAGTVQARFEGVMAVEELTTALP